MKKLLLILSIFTLTGITVFAQEDDNDGNERIRDKMNEYIQKRLRLSRSETEKFSPIFLRYFKEWRTALRQNKGDRLVMQQKIVDLRLRYRNEFREVLGEKRGNQVFDHQEGFIREMRELGKQRLEKNRPLRNNKVVVGY